MQFSSPTQAVELAYRCLQSGNDAEAENLCRQALSISPTFGPALEVFARIAFQRGQGDDAIRLIRQAINANPNVPGYLSNLGMILAELGRHEEARIALEQALALAPHSIDSLNNLGNVYISLGRLRDAVAMYRKALELRPNFIPTMQNLAAALIELGDLDAAVAQTQAILAIQPDHVPAKFVLGRAYKEAGRIEEAMVLYREADARRPDPGILSSLLFTMHFHPPCGPRQILAEHLRWNERYAVPQRTRRLPHTNDPSPLRPLRIGYVAHDLGDNALGRFLLPLLSNHDTKNFGVFCYCDSRRSDPVGQEFARLPVTWRITRNLSDDRIVQQVREDRIDILIDLSVHTHGNHLAAFAQKPAPIQITYLAYCSTTGVETIDYRLADPYLDPVGSDQSVYSEKPLRLPNCYWCYPKPDCATAVGPVPALTAGHITLGCLNDYAKVSPFIIEVWLRIMRQLPSSRMILHCKPGSHRTALLQRFADAGVDNSRIDLVGFIRPVEYFALYNRIDIALDPFPWTGGTTTCDSLWMGVPVVTMTGPTAVSRGGSSILSNVGLADLVTDNPTAYVDCAVALAGDLPRLASLRANLRSTMQNSPLMNAPQFARDVESLYRQAWQTWCASQTQTNRVTT